MILKCKTETVNTVEVDDLEQFIQETTGHAYEVVSNEEWGNDEQHRFEIGAGLLNYQQADWDTFKSTGEHRQYWLRIILDGLCADGHLLPGVYMINVSW